MTRSFFNNLSKNFNINLNQQQKEAVLHTEGPALVLAVPGAGKTTVLISRTGNLILNHSINPKNILSITFSKASALDMKNRFDSIFGKNNVHFSTIHSFAYMLIRNYSRIYDKEYILIEGKKSPINKIKVLKTIYREINDTLPSEEKLEELLNSIGFAKNMLLGRNDFSKYKNLNIKNFSDIYNEYENFKHQNSYIDFDDMLTLSIHILKNNPLILSNVRSRYKYVQVDEGQDTSKAQNEIIRLLATPRDNIFIVADDDQSIYGFRGAYPEYLLNFDSLYKNAKIFFMEQNYRSSSNIVECSNKFIKSNTIRFNKNLFTKNPDILPVNIIKFKDDLKQYEYLFDELKNNCKDSAVLFRNNISTIAIVDGLLRNNIPFYKRDIKINFFDHWIIKDILSFIQLTYDNTDIHSFERIYYKINGYISKVQVQYVKNKKSSESVFDKLITFPELKFFQKNNIKRIKDKFNSMKKWNAKDFMNSILYDLDYDKFLRENSKRFGQSYENIKIIISTLKFISENLSSPLKIQDRLDCIKKSLFNNRTYEKGKVRLSTLHSAKGLEFSRVFMVDLIDEEFPSSNSIDEYDRGNKKPLEEERRLFYVGMTRAKKDLKLITYKSRDNEEVYQSRFISELEKIIIDNNIGVASGDKVKHKSFGKGFVLDIDDDLITINFEKYGKKRISLSVSLENNLLKIVK
ncbi:UvrD-helicase domain-containing protein [Clostridium sp. D2Q-14]|uniref:ATP-dependent helicase n=1 Tax=Anaeromonas gelatinilytica TaxID=2683194 RepID=UPI00193B99ED|nr:ATP-dependent helicase [Anaeromonas gelatinilytica]MBS4536753.1 UvrD-helicase domain-containing protein [Anaeromonas gelatinilytica]